MKNFLPPMLMLSLVLLLSACIQENNPRNLSLGDVTLGAQLLDLQKAYEAEAISESEYETIKEKLVAASSLCGGQEDDDDDNWLF